MNEQMIEMLKKLAGENTLRETSDAEGYDILVFDGSYIHAYNMGKDDGEILLARYLLEMLKAQ